MVKQLRGDTGLSDLLDACDLPKSHLRFEVLGTLDEASSALGVVRSGGASRETQILLLEIQHDLCWMMSELAAVSGEPGHETHITPGRLEALEDAYYDLTDAYPLTAGFALPGDSMVGALLHLARTIIRRAERHVTALDIKTPIPNPNIIPYLNRLSTLMFAVARAEEAISGIPEPTVAHAPE